MLISEIILTSCRHDAHVHNDEYTPQANSCCYKALATRHSEPRQLDRSADEGPDPGAPPINFRAGIPLSDLRYSVPLYPQPSPLWTMHQRRTQVSLILPSTFPPNTHPLLSFLG